MDTVHVTTAPQTSVYLCRKCWAVEIAREHIVWDHTCTNGNFQRYRWEDRTDFQYLHNQAILQPRYPCPCCDGSGRVGPGPAACHQVRT